MDSRVPEIRKHLKKKLDAYRYEHTLGVEFTCQALAMRYGYDLDKADLAGLLHDSAKRFENPVMLQKCLDRGIPVTAEEERDRPCSMRNSGRGWLRTNMEWIIRRS